MFKNKMLITVGFIFGGRSVEHEVSVISAIQAIQNIDSEKYNVIPIYISKNGRWMTGDDLLDISKYKHLDLIEMNCQDVYMNPNYGDNTIYFKNSNEKLHIDVCFPILHGGTGEDGSIQGFLEMKGIPYIGCDVLASSIGMDKIAMKKILSDFNIPIVPYYSIQDNEWYQNKELHFHDIVNKIGFPAIVKPSNLGSSVGISKVTSKEELINAIDFAFEFTMQILVEKAILPLKEINCSIVGDYEFAEVSVLEEPISSGDLLSYEDKYMSEEAGNGTKNSGMSSLKRKIPPELSDFLSDQISTLSLKTFKHLNCSGVARIDFLVSEKDNIVYVNEINTIPGSLSFYLWEPKGVKYSELIDRLIKIALKRKREKNNFVTNYSENLFNLSKFSGKK